LQLEDYVIKAIKIIILKLLYLFTSSIRKHLFYGVDIIQGGRIARHIYDIKSHFNNPSISRTPILEKLLDHATATTKYYSSLENKTLSNFPVITKSVILDHFESFQSSTYRNKKLHKMTTSGSTGVPLVVLQDKNKKKRNTADTIYFAKQVGVEIGERLFYIKLWVKKNRKNALTLLAQNIKAHNILDCNDNQLTELLSQLKKYRGKKNMMVYPSFLEQLCQYAEGSKDNLPKIAVIISTSEKLNEYERKCAEQLFCSRVYERYSNMENGILAQENNISKHYIANTASYVIEMLHPEKDEPIMDGEVGRIVITDLYNYAMPMIRYDTGDMAIAKTLENGQLVFTKLFGRKMDVIYDTKGRYISPHIFYEISYFSDHKQFQFIQNEVRTYSFKLNSTKEKTDEAGMITHFKKYLGDNAIFNFDYVDEIPLLASGKRKKVLNLLNNKNL